MSNCTDLSYCHLFTGHIQYSQQKKIQNQTGVHQSQYMQNINALNNKINNTNSGIKHSSYERYLNKKKGNVLINLEKKNANTPVIGNKTQSVFLSNKIKLDNSCSSEDCSV